MDLPIIPNPIDLTPGEEKLLTLKAKGLPHQIIAEMLDVKKETINGYSKELKDKLIKEWLYRNEYYDFDHINSAVAMFL